MKVILTPLLLFVISLSYAQQLKVKNIAWTLPALNTKINGVGIGLIINSFKATDDRKLITQVNGVSIEIIGSGLFLPLVGSDPIYTEPDSVYHNIDLVDSIAKTYNLAQYKINGLALSGGGVGGYNVSISGVNLSILNTLTSKMNGLSLATIFNMSGVTNGVSIAILSNQTLKSNGLQIGLLNKTTTLKGLQVGLFNQTKHLKGFQIGLWNSNGKRKLPIVNWSFK